MSVDWTKFTMPAGGLLNIDARELAEEIGISEDLARDVANAIRPTVRKSRSNNTATASIELAGLFGTDIASIELRSSELLAGVTGNILAAGAPDMSTTLDWMRDLLDAGIPEELLGLELGGSSASGAKLYNNVWIEDGKVKYTYPNGSVRTLGYTPKAAKDKFRRKSRRKRWTTRDQKEMEWRAHIAALAAGKASVAPMF